MTGTRNEPQAVTDPCSLLPQLRAAYYQLLAGGATAEVRDGDRWMRYQRGDTKTLKAEIARLEMQCVNGRTSHRPRAIVAGNHRPLWPFNRLRSF